jgi:hypothetical protein
MFSRPEIEPRLSACAVLALAFLLVLSCASALAAANPEKVKFTLKSDAADSTAIDVNLSFKMSKGEKAVIKPSEQTGQVPAVGPAPTLELLSQANPSFAVEPMLGPVGGWIVTAAAEGAIQFDYKVKFSPPQSTSDAAVTGEAPEGALPPRAIADMNLKAFDASDALLAPQDQSGEYISEEFGVVVQTSAGESTLAPWRTASDGSYEVGSAAELLGNFIAWGKIKKVTLRAGGPSITAGFTSDYDGKSDSVVTAYGDSLLKVRDEIARVMGARPDQGQATVLVAGSGKYGLKQPASISRRDSFLLFHGGGTLTGSAAAAASRGWFDLWNGVSFVASRTGNTAWMQQGLPWFYGFRVASKMGMLDSNAAYQDFCGVYADYLTDPGALTTSLAAAQKQGGSDRLLAAKGAALCASMSVKLAKDAGGKDMEWLLGQMAQKFDHFQGKDYSLVDLSEILERATGTSWDRFFSGRVDGTSVVAASEFSTTDVFGSGGVVGGSQKLTGKGSGKNWIYLAIAIIIILAIPIVFSTYIRRSVKLDISMPKIFPGLDEDEDEAKDAEPAKEAPPGITEVTEGQLEEQKEKAPEGEGDGPGAGPEPG